MSSIKTIKVVVVEDQLKWYESISRALGNNAEIEIIKHIETGAEAIDLIPILSPDIVLVDLGLPDMNGVDIIESVQNSDLKTQFLVFTIFDDDDHLFCALQAGAVGYILKEDSVSQKLIDSIKEALGGGAPMSPSIARKVTNYFHQPSNLPVRLINRKLDSESGLTKKEREVLDLLSQGQVQKKVAQRMNISYHTVRTHSRNIYRKLNARSLLEAVAVYRSLTS